MYPLSTVVGAGSVSVCGRDDCEQQQFVGIIQQHQEMRFGGTVALRRAQQASRRHATIDLALLAIRVKSLPCFAIASLLCLYPKLWSHINAATSTLCPVFHTILPHGAGF